jgi:hypothetical protein
LRGCGGLGHDDGGLRPGAAEIGGDDDRRFGDTRPKPSNTVDGRPETGLDGVLRPVYRPSRRSP